MRHIVRIVNGEIVDGTLGWIPPHAKNQDRPDGYYRAEVIAPEGRLLMGIGKAIDPRAEAIRLRALGKSPYRQARTDKPGRQTYHDLARAATEAGRCAKRRSIQLAQWLETELQTQAGIERDRSGPGR